MQTLTINGAERAFPEGVPGTLSHLLEDLKVDAATVVAEVDGTIVNRDAFAGTSLQAGQTIELIRFVGGG